MKKTVEVSVVVLTYSHEKTIKQALDSVLMQDTDFNFEIVVGDDHSPDHTPEVLKEYYKKYPDKISLYLQHINRGGPLTLYELTKRCKGKYIAFLEGDDYWIDKNKLQIEYELLENEPEFSVVYSDVLVIDETGREIKSWPIRRIDIDNMITYFNTTGKIATCTVMFRSSIVKSNNLRHYFTNSRYVADLIWDVIWLTYGKIKYLNKKTAVYRRVVRNSTSFSSLPTIINIEEGLKARRSQLLLINNKKAYKLAIKQFKEIKNNFEKLCYENRYYKKLFICLIRYNTLPFYIYHILKLKGIKV